METTLTIIKAFPRFEYISYTTKYKKKKNLLAKWNKADLVLRRDSLELHSLF